MLQAPPSASLLLLFLPVKFGAAAQLLSSTASRDTCEAGSACQVGIEHAQEQEAAAIQVELLQTNAIMKQSELGANHKWLEWRSSDYREQPKHLHYNSDCHTRKSLYIPAEDRDGRLDACASITYATAPPPAQFDHTLDDEIVYKMIAQADHIYILCIECTRELPNSWQGKVSLVNGHKVDECMHVESFESSNTAKSTGATISHKLIVWGAKLQGHRKIAVLEEDFQLTQSGARTFEENEDEKSALTDFAKNGIWSVLRLEYFPFALYPDLVQCPTSCLCKKHSEHACELTATCDLRGTVAYMMQNATFDDFLQMQGIIDCQPIQAMKSQFVLVPSLLTQPWEAQWLKLNEAFKKSCVVN
jgi:hypothetical protein